MSKIAVNAGALTELMEDYILNPRFVGAAPDIGPYETDVDDFQGTPKFSEAVCQDVIVLLNANGEASITGQDIDGGSTDDCGIASLVPDVTDFTCANLGNNTVTLTLTDDFGNISTCEAAVVVQAVPVIELAPDARLWPPDDSYSPFSTADMVTGVADVCGASINPDDVRIVSISSDEAEDLPGSQDSYTLNDIVIAADCRSVRLRRERKGRDNGRVYTVTLGVQDADGNTAFANYVVSVPIWAWGWGGTATNNGSVYTENSSCAESFQK